MSEQKTIVFFPEAAFGPALNSVGIAQACQELGHKPVFVVDMGMAGVFEEYGFEERPINMSEPMPAEEMAKYWSDFINGHIPNFAKSPYDQIDNYVKECWEAIVETSVWAEKELPQALDEIKPDLICIDNVVLFPATKNYGVPWVRIISCSENEIEDPEIPPHLSGCGENDHAGFERYRARFNEVVKPAHDSFNEFLASVGHEPYALGEFFETSPYMNLLLYPEPVQFKRRNPLDPVRFQYLDGCVRTADHYQVPTFAENDEKPLIYVSYGSLGAGDTELLKRVIDTLSGLPYKALVNVGDYIDDYAAADLPGNIHIEAWYPQPSVIEQSDLVIHHGGNNSFTECLYYGKLAIIMPYCWDGHDNATRVAETGHGAKLARYDWSNDDLADTISGLLADDAMAAKLAATSAHMKGADGRRKAARLLDDLLKATG